MSLESAIQENTAALNALLAALLAAAKVQADQGTTTPVDLAKSKTEDVKPKAESKPKAETKPKAEPKTEPEPEPEPPIGPTFDEISAACVELIKKDRPALVALLAEFKVKKAQELKPDQFAAFKEELDAKLAAEAEEDLV